MEKFKQIVFVSIILQRLILLQLHSQSSEPVTNISKNKKFVCLNEERNYFFSSNTDYSIKLKNNLKD